MSELHEDGCICVVAVVLVQGLAYQMLGALIVR